ncbi:MAG: DNA alkylation repair protein [Candidatus Aminicenantes bacterium]|nr:DNA alkylation repair protein [Candidatus Aminicenantes bacterium]
MADTKQKKINPVSADKEVIFHLKSKANEKSARSMQRLFREEICGYGVSFPEIRKLSKESYRYERK